MQQPPVTRPSNATGQPEDPANQASEPSKPLEDAARNHPATPEAPLVVSSLGSLVDTKA